MRDELLVTLEDAAVAGIRVDPERGVGEPVSEVERCPRGEHAVVLAVRDELCGDTAR